DAVAQRLVEELDAAPGRQRGDLLDGVPVVDQLLLVEVGGVGGHGDHMAWLRRRMTIVVTPATIAVTRNQPSTAAAAARPRPHSGSATARSRRMNEPAAAAAAAIRNGMVTRA